jgi:hypothetical protein
MVVMPDGHADAGRAAFVGLGCTSCHAVAWASDLPAPVVDVGAPVLGKSVAGTSPGMIATAIIAPSHYVPKAIRTASGEDVSPMGDYSDAMTVRQLVDVVAYLKSGDGGAADSAMARYTP